MFSFPKPGVRQRLVYSDPFLRVDPQHLPEQVFGVVADVLPPGGVQAELAGTDTLVQPVLGAQEGQGAGKKDVEQDPG